MNKIFIFINAGKDTDWVQGVAISEDGKALAGHVSSNYAFFRHDMGLTSDRKHEKYKDHYPDGYELVEVDDPTPGTHKGLDSAFEKYEAANKGRP
jgi:hypothetical protein